MSSFFLLLPACLYGLAPSDSGTDTGGAGTGGAEPDFGEQVTNEGPIAVLGLLADSRAVPAEVFLSGAKSSDPEGGALQYEWDFGGGSLEVGEAEETEVYLGAGSYRIHLEVTDEAGAVGRATATLTIDPESCPEPVGGAVLGTVTDDAIIEASGLAASRIHGDVLWTHNDANNEPYLYAVATDGSVIRRILLDIVGQDLEDIAMGPDDTLYLADIGDNADVRSSLTIHRFSEPDPYGSDEVIVDSLEVTYSSGPTDAEALMADVDGSLYIIEKTSENARVFHIPPEAWDADTAVLDTVATLNVDTVTAADITALGNQIVVKNYGAAWIYLRDAGQTVIEALAGTPCGIPLAAEPQGETIAYAPDGRGYYSLSEGGDQPLYGWTW